MIAAVDFQKISKSYGAVKACRQISFAVQRGSIHALVGENGAGKSTLMNILGGLELVDDGQILIDGKSYQPLSAQDAFKNKIGFIHQHFLLAENLTVLEHLQLNWPSQKLFKLLNSQNLLKKVQSFTTKFNWSLNLNSKIQDLSVGEQQRIEIIKALLADPEIIIFDEPTAVLAPQEILDFLDFLKTLKKEGKTIILISHKLEEIRLVSDQLTVLRHGESILTQTTASISIQQIAEKMIGQKLQDPDTTNLKSNTLPLQKSTLTKNENLNLEFFHQDILGVAGIEGHGQGQFIHHVLKDLKKKKISYADIPEDRHKFGLFTGLNLVEHMALRHSVLSKNGFVRKQFASQVTQKLVQDWDVRPQNILLNAENFSGGNQQKFVIGRELFHNPDFILAAHPTRGVDLGAQQMIHSAFLKQRSLNKSILLISSDLDEVLKLADRYVILYKSKIFGVFKKNDLNEAEIGQFMTGSHTQQHSYQIGVLS